MGFMNIDAQAGQPDATNTPTPDVIAGTNHPVPVLWFSVNGAAYFAFELKGWTSGLTVDLDWYAENATTGNCKWDAAVAVVTPGTDDVDVTTKGFAAASETQTAHPGGTNGKRPLRTSITLANLDSLADGDLVVLRIRRVAASASEMANRAGLRTVGINWTS